MMKRNEVIKHIMQVLENGKMSDSDKNDEIYWFILNEYEEIMQEENETKFEVGFNHKEYIKPYQYRKDEATTIYREEAEEKGLIPYDEYIEAKMEEYLPLLEEKKTAFEQTKAMLQALKEKQEKNEQAYEDEQYLVDREKLNIRIEEEIIKNAELFTSRDKQVATFHERTKEHYNQWKTYENENDKETYHYIFNDIYYMEITIEKSYSWRFDCEVEYKFQYNPKTTYGGVIKRVTKKCKSREEAEAYVEKRKKAHQKYFKEGVKAESKYATQYKGKRLSIFKEEEGVVTNEI